MKTIYIDGAEEIRVAHEALPEPVLGQVRIKVDHVGICGSDLHYYYEGANGAFVVREPLTPGHELSGRVDFDPSGRFETNTPITIHPARFGVEAKDYAEHPHLWKGGSYLGSASTWPHTQGAMAEYLIVDDTMVRPLPEGLPVRRAALCEPLAVALHGINQTNGILGQRVLVSGAGPIGLLMAAAAMVKGAKTVTVTDIAPGALTRAQALGVNHTIDVRDESVPDSEFDIVFECSGAPAAISNTFLAVRPAGTVVQVGMVPNENIRVNMAPFVSKEVTYKSSFRFKDEIEEAMLMLAANPKIEEVITHEFPADSVVEAMAVARDTNSSGKVLVSF